WSTDNAGNTETAAAAKHIKIDLTAPVTSASAVLHSSPSTSYTFGTFTKDSGGVDVTLSAFDRASVCISFRLAVRLYTVDGGSTQTYSGVVTVSVPYAPLFRSWSTDNAGNTETAAAAKHIKIDLTAPVTSASAVLHSSPSTSYTFGTFTKDSGGVDVTLS